MHHAIRTQHDKKGDEYSRKVVLTCEGSKDVARQEFKQDADINVMLSRFGVNQQQRTTHFGQQDFTIDLQQGLNAIEETKRVYNRMSPDIKKIYSTYEKFIVGIESGAVAKDMERLDNEAKPTLEQQEILRDIKRGRVKDQLLRDEEAANIADKHRRGETTAKPEGKPKE